MIYPKWLPSKISLFEGFFITLFAFLGISLVRSNYFNVFFIVLIAFLIHFKNKKR